VSSRFPSGMLARFRGAGLLREVDAKEHFLGSADREHVSSPV
jgi:hypothetical protein